ncbi:carbohydrate ABC transporter permease [Cellulomonas sp. zg-ZUI222]|uniref:Carbohydrate ABC transporter permease n=1 Tax=Cellulomonas wangleii TaxID=2816956 RepID=A0ABX8D4L5_9CELL|nr:MULTISPECIES: carbohydrate ABC transporter permease [Cellulomonas]MBO0899054.1 carbohydrate ABC transporter permease [Cellulomonas sp. zg-ZUI22]MBO0919907.1 carbohydrate ABC transporter permease [Cellulomonas wangleii]MBO0923664.1 carbohydrate ABC transporter permease [Cellulomonas wangleii]QVI61983.1 carbohydrate ABC transporter permease [Cellulomonas wangleii]
MTTTPPPLQVVLPASRGEGDVASTVRATKRRLTSPWATVAAVVLATVWTIPTFGLLVTSFRPAADINSTGWWTVLTNPNFTLENYRTVLATDSSQSLLPFVINSVVITIPSVVLPIFLATLAAYSFAWMQFRGRDALFVAVFALQVVPIQVTLIPLLSLYADVGVAGTFWAVWLSHTMFGLPLAVFLLHNFMREIPGELVEAARVDGAAHVTVFFRLMLPLLKPALAAFGIYQFLWVWNDLLVALTFAGSSNQVAPMTVALFNLTGTRGSQWFLLSAGAFVSIIVPAVVFLALQRYFVRGLLAGSVKG